MERSLLRWYWRRVSDTVRYEGLHILLWRILRWCLSPLVDLGFINFYQRDLTQPLGEIRARVDLNVTQTTESDIQQLVALESIASRHKRDFQDEILELFRRGYRCFVGKIGTEIVHYNWISFHRKEWKDESHLIQLSNDEAFCHRGYTAEAWRGKAIHGAVNNQMLLFLREAGYRRAYTSAYMDNRSSQKALHRLGWELSCTLLYFLPRGAKKAWIWRLKGTLEPLVEKQITPREA